MTAANKQRSIDQINAINAGGGTNICSGCVMAVNEMRSRTSIQDVSSVLLFTDGQVNSGPSTSKGIIDACILQNKRARKLPGIQRSISLQQMVQPADTPDKTPQNTPADNTQQQAPESAPGWMNSFMPWASKSKPPTPERRKTLPITPPSQPPSRVPPRPPRDMQLPCTINTFGFGEGHNANLLTQIAEKTDGSYYFVENVSAIGEVFADCLGGLVSTVGQKLRLHVRPAAGATIVKPMTKRKITTEGEEYVVELGDIQSEERRDTLFVVKLPKTKGPQTVSPILSTCLKYQNVLLDKEVTVHATATMKRSAPPVQRGERDGYLDEQLNRCATAEALEKAQKLAERNQMEQARMVLEQTKYSVLNSPSHRMGSINSSMLVSDLDTSVTDMASVERFQSHGQFRLQNVRRSHVMQRSMGSDPTAMSSPLSSPSRYSTSNREVMRQSSITFSSRCSSMP